MEKQATKDLKFSTFFDVFHLWRRFSKSYGLWIIGKNAFEEIREKTWNLVKKNSKSNPKITVELIIDPPLNDFQCGLDQIESLSCLQLEVCCSQWKMNALWRKKGSKIWSLKNHCSLAKPFILKSFSAHEPDDHLFLVLLKKG